MKFVDVLLTNGKTWPVNPRQIAYLRDMSQGERKITGMVFDAVPGGLHELYAVGAVEDVRAMLETSAEAPPAASPSAVATVASAPARSSASRAKSTTAPGASG
jgi:hypothetical protein